MRRRDFIAGLAGSTTAWPVAAWGQQGERMRHIGVLLAGYFGHGERRDLG